jgi:hypothetical protein
MGLSAFAASSRVELLKAEMELCLLLDLLSGIASFGGDEDVKS